MAAMADVPGLSAAAGQALPVLAARPVPRRRALLFRAAGEWFGLALERVREVCPVAPVTRVPRAPAAVLGVMNLRGRVITLLDLACCLGLTGRPEGRGHVVVLDLEDPDLAVGLVADRLDQVVEVPGGHDAPAAPGEGPVVVELGGRAVTLLDPARIVAQGLAVAEPDGGGERG
jgi:purine-binding chemotaxis protein CheW